MLSSCWYSFANWMDVSCFIYEKCHCFFACKFWKKLFFFKNMQLHYHPRLDYLFGLKKIWMYFTCSRISSTRWKCSYFWITCFIPKKSSRNYFNYVVILIINWDKAELVICTNELWSTKGTFRRFYGWKSPKYFFKYGPRC